MFQHALTDFASPCLDLRGTCSQRAGLGKAASPSRPAVLPGGRKQQCLKQGTPSRHFSVLQLYAVRIQEGLPPHAALPRTLNFNSELFLKLSDFPSLSVLLQHGILGL